MHAGRRTHTHTEYIIFVAFARQQLSRERASLLRCTYIACLVEIAFIVKCKISIFLEGILFYVLMTIANELLVRGVGGWSGGKP
jgi:hypothetical protein